MAYNLDDINVQDHVRDPIMLVEELNSTEYYIGISKDFKDPSKANWRIKRVFKVGTVWKFEFPFGDQRFKYVWDDRLTYTYQP